VTDTPETATEPATLTRRGATVRAAIVLVAVVGLDQLVKHTLATSIAPGEQERFLPGIHFVHVRNTGVAFGLFSSGGAIVLTLTLLALAVLLAYFLIRPSRPWLWLPTGMLIGGAVGNLIDRLATGSVIDFITFGVLALLWVLEGRTGERPPARGRPERLRAR
jgi:signal peptidase II